MAVREPIDMTVAECLDHLEEIKNKQKSLHQDDAIKFAIAVLKALTICEWCDGSGTLTVPDSDGESASEHACPNPLHDIESQSEE
jgi:hypothetical protein